MLRATREVRALRPHERAEALELCSRDPASNVYVAARILEADRSRSRWPVLAYCPGDRIEALCWQSANIVPVECDLAAAAAFAGRLRRQQSQFSSIFGPHEQVEALWSRLRSWWREPLDIRTSQPLLVIDETVPLGAPIDPRLRPARLEEIDIVAPAAAAMFTEEIGYPPYSDMASQRGYWQTTRSLIERGHCLVIVEDGAVVFKAEIGSVGLGACQIQGVWVAPELRGCGISTGALAGLVAYARERVAPLVTLYVNDYNLPALAAYRRVGFTQVGTFSTILL